MSISLLLFKGLSHFNLNTFFVLGIYLSIFFHLSLMFLSLFESIAVHISVTINNFQFLTVFNQFVLLLFCFINYLTFRSNNFVILFIYGEIKLTYYGQKGQELHDNCKVNIFGLKQWEGCQGEKSFFGGSLGILLVLPLTRGNSGFII